MQMPILAEIQSGGVGAVMKHMGNPKVQRLAQAIMAKMTGGGSPSAARSSSKRGGGPDFGVD